jgi:ribose transport system permease protein
MASPETQLSEVAAAPTAVGLARRRPRAAAMYVVRFAPVIVPWVMLAALVAIYSSRQEGVLTREELNFDAAATLTLLLVATGQTLVILLGGIDLSVGGIVSVSTALAATRFGDGGSDMAVWALAIVGVGAAAGAANGILIARLKLQPFIVTLATWSIWSGVAFWLLPTEGGSIPESFSGWVDNTYLGLTTPVWLVAALIVLWLWFKRTPLGVGIKATGSSENSAFLSGVPTGATTIAAYSLSGLFAALAGLFLTTQTASGSPTVGNDYILNSVAAVVIGGTSLFGGRGGLSGTIAGAFLLTMIANVIFAYELEAFWSPITYGVLLILAVLANSLTELYANRQAYR